MTVDCPNTPNAVIRIIDLFAGPGGWDMGLAHLGRRDVIGIEWDDAACATARAAGHLRVKADISFLNPRAFAATHMTCVEGLIASPPCQGFSAAGKGLGRGDTEHIFTALKAMAAGEDAETALAELRLVAADHRSALVLEPLRWALALRPEWIAWEQVPTVLPLWEACGLVLEEHGYSAWAGNLHAEQYGVPQTRRRAILIASRTGTVAPPPPTHSRYYPRDPSKLDPGLHRWVSMAEALGRGMTVRPSLTVTSGGTDTGGAEPFGNGARQRMQTEAEEGRWVDAEAFVGGPMAKSTVRALDEPAPTVFTQRTANLRWRMRSNYGTNGVAAARGERDLDEPAPTVTSKINRNLWFAGAGATSEQTAGQIPRPVSDPAHTITGKGTAAWVYRGSNQAHAAKRPLDAPAPTVNFAERVNKVEWMPAETAPDPAARGIPLTIEEASILQDFPPDYPWAGTKSKQFRQIGDAVPPGLAAATVDAAWTRVPPATVVHARHDDADERYSDHAERHSVRVTTAEAAVLQAFPADYPWAGTKTDCYRQIGDAVPPLLAAHVLTAAGAAHHCGDCAA